MADARSELIRPMLATLVPKPFHREGWVYEEKYDGIRILAQRRGRRVRLFSRSLQDLTAQFPEIARALEELSDGDFVLDGEIVAFDRHGVSRFQLLQRRAHGEPIRLALAGFDCLQRAGVDLLRRPLAERREALEAIVPERGVLMRARRLPPNGFTAYRIAQERGWEGIIAKDDASPYQPGRRSGSWLKVKCRNESEFVIGGFTAPAGQRQHFGALLVGLFEGPTLRFAGKVGADSPGRRWRISPRACGCCRPIRRRSARRPGRPASCGSAPRSSRRYRSPSGRRTASCVSLSSWAFARTRPPASVPGVPARRGDRRPRQGDSALRRRPP